MDPKAILDELTHAAGLPAEALRAASAQRNEMVPLFLREIEDYLARAAETRDEPTPLFWIFHLFGEWREKSAYKPLARLLRRPDIEDVLGDAITSTSNRVMAAVFDGDPQPLYDVILDPDADEFVRSRMCGALATVVLRGELDRAAASRFLGDAFTAIRPQAECFVWFGWQSTIAVLGLSELTPLVRQAFDRGFVDRHWLDFTDFEEDLAAAIARPGTPPRGSEDNEFTLFGDTVEELSGWYGFSEAYRVEQERALEAGQEGEDEVAEFLGDEPYRNPLRSVGRNDPCPCGSGKKFKNCCLPR
ncbi:MAG TPA: DUF1186 domain-containing protein [Stellaceae bacterium]|nr:DUF1186 domain-containing protein [Stellaceae bacterium]